MPLSEISAVISDMDGVLWRGDTPLPMLSQFFAFLRQRDLPFVLATNNSGRHTTAYIQKLAHLGVPDVQAAQIVTSATATVDYLKEHHPQANLFVIGNAGLFQTLREANFTVLTLDDDQIADVVVCGIDFEFSYEKARHACLQIRNHGATFIGTNPDLTFPSPQGLVPGAGSLVHMIEVATDTQALIIGKPKAAMFEVALKRLAVSAEQCLMIGDRLSTDIVGAQALGIQTALVLTGVNTRDEVQTVAPTYIFDDLGTLMQAWDV